MKRAVIAIATWFLKLEYLLVHAICGAKNQIVCLSRQSDSAPLDFFLLNKEIARTHPDYQVIILAKTISNPLQYAFHMLRQTATIARSKAVVLDSYCIVVSLLRSTIQAPVIQIWHAMGNMKRFGYATLDLPEGRSSEVARLMHMHEGYDSLVISSKSFVDDYVAGFHANPSIIFECPLPKADLLVSEQNRSSRRAEIIATYPHLGEKTNIVYCPTFRKPITAQDRGALSDLANAIDFDRYNLIYKRHPVSKLPFDDPRVFQDYDPGFDMLYVADCVISDYSTVIYEAGLMGIPVYLYIYDWSTYRDRRGINLDFEKDIPAPKAKEASELVRMIEDKDFDPAAYAKFIQRNISLPESQTCSEKLVEHIFELVESSKN